MYLRFATFRIDPDAHRPQGIFLRAYVLLASDGLYTRERRRLRESLTYFEHDLDVPRVWERRAVFWFKAECALCTHHAWALVNALKASGVPVQPVRTTNPGLVIYEDGCQIAAIPYRDTFRSRSHPPCRARRRTRGRKRSCLADMVQPLRIAAVRVLGGRRVELALTDGSTKAVDLTRFLSGPVFDWIAQDDGAFEQVRVDPELGTIMWPNGADLCPDVLIYDREPAS